MRTAHIVVTPRSSFPWLIKFVPGCRAPGGRRPLDPFPPVGLHASARTIKLLLCRCLVGGCGPVLHGGARSVSGKSDGEARSDAFTPRSSVAARAGRRCTFDGAGAGHPAGVSRLAPS